MKYEAHLAQVNNFLPQAKNILIALPKNPTIDHLASGLALYLSLAQAGRSPVVATEGIIRVGHTSLFGVGQIQSKIPQGSGGDFVITLGGVVDADGRVPAVEKMDYFPIGSDLNLVFKVLPGQKFEPTSITPRYEGGGFDLIFAIGALNLEDLGSIYSENQAIFAGNKIINIVNQGQGSQFGATNIVDPTASSICEMMAQILPDLHLPIDGDIATNLLTGIFTATDSLQTGNVSGDTYEAVALAVRSGGIKPTISAQEGFDLNKIFQAPTIPPTDNFTMPPVVTPNQPSPEEVPTREGVETITPEVDWLTPKIFKGSKGSLG